MRWISRIVAFSLTVFVPSVLLQSQDYQVTVQTVTVWLKATDKSGQPIPNLKQEDFEIYEDNTKVPTTCFEEVNVAATSSADANAAPQAPPHKFVLFLDLYNTSVPEYSLVKPKLQDFLRQLQGKNIQVMVVALVPNGKFGVAAPYTTDMQAIISLLDQAKPNLMRDQEVRSAETKIVSLLSKLKPVDDVQMDSLDEIMSEGLDSGGARGRDSRNPDKENNRRLIQGAFQIAQSHATREESEAEMSLRAFESFAEFLARNRSETRMVIIHVSGGFNSDPGRRYYEMITRAAERMNMRGDSMDFDSRYSSKNRDEHFRMREMVEKSVGKLNRFNVIIYSINTRGMAPFTDQLASKPELVTDMTKILPDYQEGLSQISRETGGVPFLNSQNFKLGFDRIWNDVQHYYLICYKPPESQVKGKYHRIKVVAKEGGLSLRHRTGYFQ